jgi:cytochrome c-type biogenesis protein CcmH/NrfF
MRRRTRIFSLVLALGGLIVLALLPRAASAGPMHDAGSIGLGDMTPHAPIEVHVSPALKKVLQGVICQCGCNLDAYQCKQTMTCDVSTAMWDQAKQIVDRDGKTPEQALALFASDYGERVLASPLKRGFNLTAWGLPFAALAVGGLVLGFALRRWRPAAADGSGVDEPEVDKAYRQRIERELAEED